MSMSGSDFGAPCDDPKIFRNICRDRILKDLLQPDKDKETKSSWKVVQKKCIPFTLSFLAPSIHISVNSYFFS
jgi:hypothetical protein